MKQMIIILFFIITPTINFAQQLVGGSITVSSSCLQNDGKKLTYTLCGWLEAIQNTTNTGSNYSDMQYTQISDKKNETGIMAYPNPANQYITIKADNASGYYLRIFNISGMDVTHLVNSRKKIINQNEKIELNISHLSEGKYFITLFPIKKTITRKTISILKK